MWPIVEASSFCFFDSSIFGVNKSLFTLFAHFLLFPIFWAWNSKGGFVGTIKRNNVFYDLAHHWNVCRKFKGKKFRGIKKKIAVKLTEVPEAFALAFPFVLCIFFCIFKRAFFARVHSRLLLHFDWTDVPNNGWRTSRSSLFCTSGLVHSRPFFLPLLIIPLFHLFAMTLLMPFLLTVQMMMNENLLLFATLKQKVKRTGQSLFWSPNLS